MAAVKKRGATRKPVRKQRQPVAWQHWLRYSLMGLLLIVVVSSGVYLQQDDTLPILHVSVEGDFVHANKDELVKAVSPFVTGSFVNVDVASIRDAGEALPWIQLVQVRRIWPDSLHLIVEEQTAMAHWGSESLINAKGEIFTPAKSTIPTGLAKLEGVEGSNVVMSQRLLNIQQQVKKLGLIVTKIKLSQRRAWSIQFDNGLEVVLGRADSEQRLQRFITVFKANLNEYRDDIAVVDMRYTNGMSVIWKQGQKPDFIGTV